MFFHPVTNFEIQKYDQNESKSNVYSRNNLPEIKDRTYVINLDEFKWIGTHSIALYVNRNDIIYFDNFRVEHNLKEIKKFIKNIYRIQENDSIICVCFCIGFIDLSYWILC